MKSPRTCRRGPVWIAAVFVLGACALPGTQEPGVVPPAASQVPDEWRFSNREHVSLWYHGLGFVLPPADSMPLPIYSASEQRSALAAARRAGVSVTPIERGADSLAHEFAGSSAYDQLQFLPLYFDNAQALFNAIRVWEQADGDPQRAGSQEGAQAVAILSGMFTTVRQRRWVAAFAQTLQAESSAYYGAYWRQREPALRALADSARASWTALQPALAPLLRYLQMRGGEALLTPSLSAEGRTVTSRTLVRAGVGAEAGTSGADVASRLLHEIMYSLVGDVVREHVAPAVLRDLGEDVVMSRAAVRAGAVVLERLAPVRAESYRRHFLRAAGRTGGTDAAFRAAFPLPAELERGLTQAVEQALAGI